MKEDIMKKLVFILFLCSFFSIHAEEKAIIQVNAELLHKEKISPLMNGGFIEFLLNYVNGYGGMWAQEITDRGFDYISGQKYKYWDFWYSQEGKFDFVKNVSGGYNENGLYGIEFTGDGTTESGIFQKIYVNDKVSHKFYIYTKNKDLAATGKLKLVAFNSDFTNRFFEKEIDISSSDWKKIEFEIPAIPDVYSYNFAITYKGEGKVEIDEVSLMPTDNEFGLRKEWADLFRIWKPGIMRYPGGWFADRPTTFWQNSISHIDKRFSPDADQLGNLQRVDMGTDEFVKICKVFNIEPYFVTNINRSYDEAANWVEYCNGDHKTTLYGKLREQNGSPEPYNVKYWEIGNEQYYHGILKYIPKYLECYDKMIKKDPSIRVITNGCHYTNVFDTLMPEIKDKCNIYGFHPAGGCNRADFGDDEKRYLSVVSKNYTIGRLEEYAEKIKNYPNLKLASTEWWSSYGVGNDWVTDTISRSHSIEALLWNVAEFLLYMRYTDIVEFASRTMGIGLFKQGINSAGKKVIYVSPSLYGIALASHRRGEYIIKNQTICNSYSISEIDYWAEKTPYLDVTTSISEDSLFIAVINRHPRKNIVTDLLIDLEIVSNYGKVYDISGEHFLDCNTADEPTKVIAKEKDWKISDKYDFPKHSFTILAIPVKHDLTLANGTAENQVNIYPVPTNHFCNIVLNSGQFIKYVEIFDVLGNKLFSKDINEFKNALLLENLNLPIGFYYIKIECLDETYSKAIIINKLD
ncbi:MAG: T9SS type A sorting domain-containing protein [Ignavibacteria bacterium]|jgi:alpha-N-arabinofuranosidase|nr:T9SS type A sorting domain-containing protein [Ignavibacteria bacterium]